MPPKEVSTKFTEPNVGHAAVTAAMHGFPRKLQLKYLTLIRTSATIEKGEFADAMRGDAVSQAPPPSAEPQEYQEFQSAEPSGQAASPFPAGTWMPEVEPTSRVVYTRQRKSIKGDRGSSSESQPGAAAAPESMEYCATPFPSSGHHAHATSHASAPLPMPVTNPTPASTPKAVPRPVPAPLPTPLPKVTPMATSRTTPSQPPATAPTPLPTPRAATASAAQNHVPPPPPPPAINNGPPQPHRSNPSGASKLHGSAGAESNAEHVKHLRWESLKPNVPIESTMWGGDAQGQSQPFGAISVQEQEKITGLFTKSSTSQKKPRCDSSEVESALDHLREKNVSIVLKCLRLPLSEIEERISTMQTSSTFGAPAIASLLQVRPRKEDLAAVEPLRKEYMAARAQGNADHPFMTKWSESTKFVLMAGSVPRFAQRLECWHSTLVLDDEKVQIEQCLDMVHRAVRLVRESKHLPMLLQIILAIGNFLNTGKIEGGEADSRFCTRVTLSSVSGFFLVRASKGGGTLLEFLVTLVQKRCPEVEGVVDEMQQFLDEIASKPGVLFKLNIPELRRQVREFRERVDGCEQLLKMLAAGGDEQPLTTQSTKQVLESFLVSTGRPVMLHLNSALEKASVAADDFVAFMGESTSQDKILIEILKALGEIVRSYSMAIRDQGERELRRTNSSLRQSAPPR